MATAVATPALAAATRAFAREPGACKTLIAADFGSRTRGSARAPATRAALGARAGARAATHVLRARVAGGMEWNDEANGETNDDDDDDDDDDTERRDDANGERTKDERVDFESEGFEGRGGREDKNQSNDDDEKALSSRDASSARERSFEHETSARWVSSDENWLDDPRFGCEPGQLWVNAIASVGATQNPKHANHFAEFLARLASRRGASTNGDVFGIEPGTFPFANGGFARHAFDPEWYLAALAARDGHASVNAAELRFVLDHPLAFGTASVALGCLCLTVSRRRRRAKALKASLLNDGVDLTNVFGDHLETLEYLHTMRERSQLALGIETCAAKKVAAETRYLGVAALRDWREFYGSRGIDLATKDDVKKVKAYVQHLHHLEGCLLGKGASGEKSELLGGEER